MVKFPISFEVSASASSGAQSIWTGRSGELSPISSAIPPEFMGPGGGYSPEDLFALSLLNCLIATFKVYADKGNVHFERIDGKVKLEVDRIAGGSGFWMARADLFLDIKGSSNSETVRKLLDLAIKDCAVGNSIKTAKTFHINIS